MKLRLRGNSIRLRLTQGEVRKLVDEGIVAEFVEFGQGKTKFCYELERSEDTDHVTCIYENDSMRILLPEKLAFDWCTSETVSIGAENGGLRILVEKDFACLNPRAGEDESDMFPNPEIGKC